MKKNKLFYLLIIFISSSLMFNCSNEQDLNYNSKELVLKDSNKTKMDTLEIVSLNRNDSLIAAEEEYFKKLKEVLKDSLGVIHGKFDTFEQGDYGHISIIDSNDLLISLYVFDDLGLSQEIWENLTAGKYKNKKVEVSWERKEVFLDASGSKEKIEIAKTFRFNN